VGVYPRLEARLMEIRIGSRDVGAAEEEEATGCAECGGSKDAVRKEPCSDDSDTTDDESDYESIENTGKAWDKSCWNDGCAVSYQE
jgi:hypothetical protein